MGAGPIPIANMSQPDNNKAAFLNIHNVYSSSV